MNKTTSVLVIEDNKGSSVLVKSNFEQSKLDVELTFTISVSEALSVIKRLNRDSESPDIILLDLSMPKEDGWDFLDQYYELDLLSRSKIFILTTSINIKDKQKGKDYPDVVAFYNKPMTVSKSYEIFNLYEAITRIKK